MAYSPLYNTHVTIDSFRGIDQSGDGYNLSLRYATDMENVNIEGGGFQPMRSGVLILQTLAKPIGTLAYLHRRFGQDTGTLLVAVSDGRVYTKLLDGDDDWKQRYPSQIEENRGTYDPDGDPNAHSVTETSSTDEHGRITTTIVKVSGKSTIVTTRTEVEVPLAINDSDWVTYEISLYPAYAEQDYKKGQRVTKDDVTYKALEDITAEAWNPDHWAEITQTDPVDILLFSNATDGMFCLYGDTLDVAPVETPKKFGVLARYNERIWGSGITGDPDMLVYSAPYDPFDWEAQIEIPEDGAGDIQVPTWDGDSFVALRQYGSDLIALKRNSIWRVYGTNPGEFTVQRQYGGGALVENTVAVYNGYAYMLGEYGLLRYDGSGAYAFMQDSVQGIMRDRVKHEITALLEYSETRVYMLGDICSHDGAVYRCVVPINNAEAWTAAHWEEISGDPVSRACAGMWNGVYCLALPFYGSANNNAILQYDTRSGAFSLRTDVSVDSFLQINERLFYTSADYPGAVYELDDRKGRVKHVKWVSGYQDLGLKSSIKSAFTVYFYAETEVPVTLRLGLRTEKKLKQKVVTVKPGKITRTHLNTQGRIFRLEIESITAVPYAIAGGIKIDLELDPD